MEQVWRFLSLFSVLLVVSACNSDSLNVVPGDEALDTGLLGEAKLLTDEVLIPKVQAINLYDTCGRNNRGSVTCSQYKRVPLAGASDQTAVSAPSRVMITMDRPVYLDDASQVDFQVNNGIFYQSSGSLQPLEIASDADTLAFEEVILSDALSLQNKQYKYFTTLVGTGDIYPESDGQVVVTMPEGIVYTVNANGKKIYNHGGSGAFVYDTSRPSPKLRLLDINGGEITRMSADSGEYGTIQLEINWGEDEAVITPLDDISSVLSDRNKLLITCSGCTTNDPVYSTRIYNARVSNTTTYYVALVEDASFDGRLTTLQDKARLSFIVDAGIVEDGARNTNQQSSQISISIDDLKPIIESVSVSLSGLSPLDGGMYVMNIGDAVRFRLTFSESVDLISQDDIVLNFDVGGLSLAQATPNFAASGVDGVLGGVGTEWRLDYIIPEEKGDNKIGSEASDFRGQSAPDLSDDSWLSDFSQQYEIQSNDKVFDLAGNPLDDGSLGIKYFTSDSGLQKVHVDGKRPRIITDIAILSSYIKRLSGHDTSVDTDIIPNGEKLAFAIPFSEAVTDGRDVLDFKDFDSWKDTQLNVKFFSDDVGDRFSHSKLFAYDHDLTQFIASDPYFSDHPYMVVFSLTVDETYPQTGSMQIVALEGLPARIKPVDLMDYAGNFFLGDQATSDRFLLNIDVLSVRIDGGPFGISSVYPMYKDSTGRLSVVPESVLAGGQRYVQGDHFYVGMLLTKEISRSVVVSRNAPKLKIKIRTLSGQEVDLESVAADFLLVGDDLQESRDTIVFDFDLSGDHYVDNNGVEVVSVSDSNRKLVDINDTSLVYASDISYTLPISSGVVRGAFGDGLLSQVWIDNAAPSCNSAYLTDKATGNPPASYYTVNRNKPLYLVVQCDERMVFNPRPDGTSDSPYVYNTFGAGNLGLLFRYSSLAQAGRRIVYSMPMEFGYQAGRDGVISVDGTDAFSIKKYYNSDTNDSGEFDFFRDEIGNVAVASSLFVNQRLYELIDVARTTGNAITVNTSPEPIQVSYQLPDGAYVDADGVTYLPGGGASRDDGKNVLTLRVDYGYFGKNEDTGDINNPVYRALLTDGDEDASIDMLYYDRTQAGAAQLDIASFTQGGTFLLYKMVVDYLADGSPSYQLLLPIQSNQAINISAGNSKLPYARDQVVVYDVSGNRGQDKVINTPISVLFPVTTVGLGSIPAIKINNSRPKLVSNADNIGTFPIEVWAAVGRNMGALSPKSDTSRTNDNSLFFGDIYFALVFDKDMSDDSFSGTFLNVDISRDVRSTIDSTAMDWVSRDVIRRDFDTQNVVDNKKIFYRYRYGDSKYSGDGFIFNKSVLLKRDDGATVDVVGKQEDIYGNFVDLSVVASSLKSDDDYDVLIEARSDIDRVYFDNTLYKYGDTVRMTVETSGRLKDNIDAGKLLALRAYMTRDEASAADEVPVYMVQEGSIETISPGTDGYENGATRFVLSYALDSLDDQFNDDITNDIDRGISLSGVILLCSPHAQDIVTDCAAYETEILNSIGEVSRTAALSVSGVPGISALASVNSLLPYIAFDGNKVTDLATVKRIIKGEALLREVTSATIFRNGDKIIFDVPVQLQQERKFTTEIADNRLNYDSSKTSPVFKLKLYNIVSGDYTLRQASFLGVEELNKLRFEYVISSGDYAGVPQSNTSIVRNNGLYVTDAQRGVFDLSDLISAGNSSVIDSLTDDIYGNPVVRSIYDNNKDQRTVAITDLSGDLNVDSRAYIENVIALTSAGLYTVGDDIEFVLDISDFASASSSPVPEATVTIVGTGRSEQIKAIYKRTDTADTSRLIFGFTTIRDVLGTARVTDVSFDGVRSYIRSEGINIDNDLSLSASTHLTGLSFDSQIPEITSVSLRSPEGYYGSSDGKVRVVLGITKNIVVTGVTSGARPSIAIALDTKGGGTKAYNLVYDSLASTKSIVFAIDPSDLSDDIQDYDGMDVTATSITLPSGVTIRDSAGNDLLLDLSNDVVNVASALEAFNVSIDVSRPKIVRVIETRGNVVDASADYSADSEMSFVVTFDETVDFASTSPAAAYALDVSFDSQVKSATPSFAADDTGRGDNQYTFSLDVGNGYDITGLDLKSFTVADGYSIQDIAGNALDASLTDASYDLSKVHVDAKFPEVTATFIAASIYAADYTIDAKITFGEPVTVVGVPSVSVKLGDAFRTFTYGRSIDSTNYIFSYKVLSSDSESTVALIQSPLSFSDTNYIADMFGNKSPGTFSSSEISGIQVIPSQGAVVVAVKAYKRGASDQNPVLIVPNAVATILGVAHKLFMEVEYNTAVSVSGIPTLTFEDDNSKLLTFVYKSIDSANTKLTFELDAIPLGIYAPGGIRTTGDILRPSGASISVSGITAAPSYSVNANFANDRDTDGILETVAIDTLAATISDVSVDAGYFKAGDNIAIKVLFDETVDVVGTGSVPQLQIVLDSAQTRTVSWSCASCSADKSLTFTYTVAASDNAAGIRVSNLSLPTGISLRDDYNNSVTGTISIDKFFSASVIDTEKPGALTFSSAVDDVGLVTGQLSNAATSDDETPSLSWDLGSSGVKVGDTVSLYGGSSGNTLISSSTVDLAVLSNNRIVTTPDTSNKLVQGMHILRTRVSDIAGNISDDYSGTFVFTVDSTMPGTPSLSVIDNEGSQTGEVSDGGNADSDTLLMLIDISSDPKAVAGSGYNVLVKNSGTTIKSARVTSDGAIRVSLSDLIRAQDYAFTATLVNAIGVESLPSNEVKVTVINPPVARAVDPVMFENNDANSDYSQGDIIKIFFNQPVDTSLLNSIDDLAVTGGKILGTGATLSPDVSSSLSNGFNITLGSGTTVKQGTTIFVASSLVRNGSGTTASENIVFVLPDVIVPSSVGDALPYDVGVGNLGVFGAGDLINLGVSEPIDGSKISTSSMSITGSGTPTFGTGYTVAIIGDNSGSGYAYIIQITLGVSPQVSTGDTVSVNGSHVVDLAGNAASNTLTYTVLDIDTLLVKDISVNPGEYSSGDAIDVEVVFSNDVTVDVVQGSSITIDLDIGGSVVQATYQSALSDTVLFSYIASGVVDQDGITVITNSIKTGANDSIRSIDSTTNANITFPTYSFPNVLVNAPFGAGTASLVWLDGSDPDGDGDGTDHESGDSVGKWWDKSGADNHISQTVSDRQPSLSDDSSTINSTRLSPYIDSNDSLNKTSGIDPDNVDRDSYTYYAVSRSTMTSGTGTVFSTASSATNGHGILVSDNMFSASVVTQGGEASETVGSAQSTPSILGDIAISGVERYTSYNGTETLRSSIANFVTGSSLYVGSNAAGSSNFLGFVSEILYYKSSLSQAERHIVNNYLSSKWDVSIAQDMDHYSGDGVAIGNYDNGVTGVIKLVSSSVAAVESGGLQISNSLTFLQDAGDAVFVGSKGQGTTSDSLPDYIGSTVRSSVVWYIDITDIGTPGGSVDIMFRPAQIGLELVDDATSYEMFWRSAENEDFARIAVANAIIDGLVTFSDLYVDTTASADKITSTPKLLNDGYITVGVNDQNPPRFRSAQITGNNTITLIFDEALGDNPGGFSLASGNTISSQTIHSKASNKLVLTTVNSVNSDTLMYSGLLGDSDNIRDTIGNLLTSIPSVVFGTSSDDTLTAGAGGSIVIGNAGADAITAGSGSDVFDYNSLSDGVGDSIIGFSLTADKIDLADLLEGVKIVTIEKFIKVDSVAADTVVRVDVHGRSRYSDGAEDVSITLKNINGVTLGDFLNGGNFIIGPQ